ncbi:MAG: DNA double-strand break repair nuclease NurA [Candidatus Aenigmatarchaeota archaeon]
MIEFLFKDIVDKFKKEEEKLNEICNKIVKSLPVKKKIDISLNEFSICAVDSGYTKKLLHVIDVSIIKVASVFMKYENDKLVYFKKYPDNIKEEIFCFKTFSELELNKKLNEKRWLKEVKLAEEACKLFKPDFLFLDGPLLNIHVSKKCEKEVFETFSSLINEIKNLVIVGVVEDSRSTALCTNLASLDFLTNEERIIIDKTIDTNLAYHLLNFQERTISFFIDKNIYFFYLRNSKLDRPLRVEIFSNGKDIENIADKVSYVLIKTAFSETYPFPVSIIEADLASRVNENAIDEIYEKFRASLESLPSLLKLRRNSRPF